MSNACKFPSHISPVMVNTEDWTLKKNQMLYEETPEHQKHSETQDMREI